ncbi:GNAT family N-acetyltransferase [Pseudonocardia sp. MH-G8]|uniref:GNAT family N-acetyltransferase n=1 Tax=Pseudonocardia sp. MH-G8 TaxID=1854588 RepID=UPI001E4235A2|nr:GNAT family N-acetyltransferase [Pseudonocardia sp. MH-G8]
MAEHPLDNPVLAALADNQAALGERKGRAVRYQPDIAPFAALPADADDADWADLAALAGPAAGVVITGPVGIARPPALWQPVERIAGMQMDGSGLDVRPDPEAVVLGESDVPEMLDLVARTRPGPFRTRTRLLGTYLGFRRGGALVAMAGERMRPPGWAEVSAVCTDPAHRGRGLAARLVRAVGAVARERGDVPFLHLAASNTGALRLYEQLGFTVRSRVCFALLRTPD